MPSISTYRSFFGRCRQFVGTTEKQGCQDFTRFFDRVRPEMSRLLEAVRQEERCLAPRFNIFRALRIERKEAVCHTPMLAHLLDPSASHGQGSVFLKSFLQVLEDHGCRVPRDDLLHGGQWAVLREFSVFGVGIMDVLIENPAKKCIIVIENKIDSEDHAGQLGRYQKWLEKNRSEYEWRQLIYLTPDGRSPGSVGNDNWLCLSYRKDISGFLAKALPEVRASCVRDMVYQYQAIVNGLTEESDDQGE